MLTSMSAHHPLSTKEERAKKFGSDSWRRGLVRRVVSSSLAAWSSSRQFQVVAYSDAWSWALVVAQLFGIWFVPDKT